jgi:hypothetical protein
MRAVLALLAGLLLLAGLAWHSAGACLAHGTRGRRWTCASRPTC